MRSNACSSNTLECRVVSRCCTLEYFNQSLHIKLYTSLQFLAVKLMRMRFTAWHVYVILSDSLPVGVCSLFHDSTIIYYVRNSQYNVWLMLFIDHCEVAAIQYELKAGTDQ